MFKKIPLILTFLRILLVPIFIYLWFLFNNENSLLNRMILLFIFLLISITDYFDGMLARKFNAETSLGKLLDPLADKILIYSCLILFTNKNIIDPISVILMISREFLITGIRMNLLLKKLVLPADYLGKIKTFFQIFSISLLILFDNSNKIVNQIYYISVFLCIISLTNYIRYYIKMGEK